MSDLEKGFHFRDHEEIHFPNVAAGFVCLFLFFDPSQWKIVLCRLKVHES